MNEFNPEALQVESAPAETPCYDRSIGLVLFGILTIVIGCLCAVAVPITFLGSVLSPNASSGRIPMSATAPGACMYAIMAVSLIWLGIGSIMARRWARTLLFILSYSWLIVGVIAMVMLAFLLCLTAGTFPPPGTSGTPTLPAELEVGMTNRFLIDCVIFLVIPAIWTFFYNSRHVKLTCERRDPVRRWTDACPLPVLGFCIWLLFSALMMLIMPIAMQGVMPFFGMFLTGWLGALFYLAIAALLVFAADLVYRLDSRGWWLIVLLLSVQMISSILTFALRDVMEMYRLMDYPQAQMDPIEKLGMFKGYIMMWIVLSCTLPVLGYLFYIKKYFRPRSAN